MPRRKPMKVLLYISIAVFILCIPLFLVTSDLSWAVNEGRLYEYGFDKYNVSQTTGISDEELTEIARGLIHYFDSGEIDPSFDIFDQREMTHLKDVRGLIQVGYCLQWAALGYIIAFIIGGLLWRRGRFAYLLSRLAVAGSALTFALLIVMGIASLADFDWLFRALHPLFFSGDSYVLYGYLPQLFTEGFFLDATLLIMGAVAVEALLIGLIGGFFALRERRARG